MKVYVATSWRNDLQPFVVSELEAAGHEVYDFRNPIQTGEDRGRKGLGFHWSEIDPEWQSWTPAQYRKALDHDVARDGFDSDMDALEWADALVMVQPCGRSAALEMGWCAGAGKPTLVLLAPGEPELMLSMATFLCLDVAEVVSQLQALEEGA